MRVLKYFPRRTIVKTEEDVIDKLANLLHWCEKENVDFYNCLRIAKDHYEFEK